ncbi:unnamed protein product [Schistosoma turkestanicum]|nr:unnamed protein product [Schistosoma turkestanicum]
MSVHMSTPYYVQQSHLSWIPGTAGDDQPSNGVEADPRIYVVRGEIDGNIIPGKMPLRIGAAFIPNDGKEYGLRNFEILCNTNIFPNQSLYNWIPESDGRVPAGALIAGATTDGLPLYVARAPINDEMCVGKDLIDVTHHVHYTNYFSSRLTSIAEASKFLATEDSREPLSQLETERLAHQRKLAKLESEMENVFEQKVHERTNKLIETERDLVERAEQSEKHLLLQLTEFEKRRQEFEDERAMWEAENREALEALQITTDRGDFLKDKFRIKRKGLF